MKLFVKIISLALSLLLAVSVFVTFVSASQLSNVRHVTLGDDVQEYPESARLGVNIHCVDNPSYRLETLEEQVALIARLGVKFVRLGHLEVDLDYSDKLMLLLKKYGIKVMMVYCADIKTDPDELETLSETLAMLLTRYNGENGRGRIDYVQIGNETDIGLHEAKKSGTGRDPADYFIDPVAEDPTIPNLKTAKVFFDTLFAVVRKTNKNVKTCINFCYTNYGMVRWFQDQGVDFDVVGWDWYYSSVTSNPEITAQMCDELHYYFPDKEMIVCETNIDTRQLSDGIKAGTKDHEDPHNWDGLLAILDVMVEKNYFQYIAAYELLDECLRSDNEAFYGLVNTDSSGMIGQPHPIYYDLQKRFGGDGNRRKILLSELDMSGYEALKVKTADDTGIVIDKQSQIIAPFNFINNLADDSYNGVLDDEGDDTFSDQDDLNADISPDPGEKAAISIKRINQTVISRRMPLLLTICAATVVLAVFGAALFLYLKKKKP